MGFSAGHFTNLWSLWILTALLQLLTLLILCVYVFGIDSFGCLLSEIGQNVKEFHICFCLFRYALSIEILLIILVVIGYWFPSSPISNEFYRFKSGEKKFMQLLLVAILCLMKRRSLVRISPCFPTWWYGLIQKLYLLHINSFSLNLIIMCWLFKIWNGRFLIYMH